MRSDKILHIYTRVSTQTQQDEGTSLASQKELGIKKAKELGFAHKVWNEGGASSNYETFENRPILLKLLDEIDAGNVRHIWVYNNDRLSRNPITAQTIRAKLQKNSVTFYTNTGRFDLNNHQDRFLKAILDEVAQLDNAQRAERTRLGKVSRIKQGFWMGGPPPFGYEIREKKLELHKAESKWVKQIFEWYAVGKSTEWIKVSLDKAGVKTRRDKGLWSLGSIQKMLQNTHPAGHYVYVDAKTNEAIKCSCPPIVSTTLWNKCQEKRLQTLARRGQNNRTKRFYLLRNLLYCGHCGSAMSGRIKEDKNEYLYYCPRKERAWVKGAPKPEDKWKRGVGCSMTRSLNIQATDDLVIRYILPHAVNEATVNRELKEYKKEKGTAGFDKNVALKQQKNKQRNLEREIENVLQQIADVEAAKILENKDERVVKKVLENFNKLLRETEMKLEQCKLEIVSLEDQQLASDLSYKRIFLNEIDPDILRKKDIEGELGPHNQRWLQSIVERIEVKYNNEKNEHDLTVRFKLPLYNGWDTTFLKLKKNEKAA